MCVDSLEETKRYPDVNRQDVQVASKVTIQDRPCNCSCAEDEYFRRVRVFGCESEWRRVLVVDLVDVLIQHTDV